MKQNAKNRLETARAVARIILYTSALLSIAAKTRKDITIHGKHDEHSPCPCDKQCLICLLEG